jgi:hypothetical protein|eukprot:jgi/Chrpa1/10690/Chrysochromulina_OHIO_Genome00019338-RA
MPIDWNGAILSGFLLCCSCCVMVTAWYLHLRMKESWNLGQAIVISWLIAGLEYCLLVPANRIGAQAGLSAAQLRGLAEVAILIAFLIFQVRVLGQPLLWNHLVGFSIVFLGVLVVLGGPFPSEIFHVAPTLEHMQLANVTDSSAVSHAEGTELTPSVPPAPLPPRDSV